MQYILVDRSTVEFQQQLIFPYA